MSCQKLLPVVLGFCSSFALAQTEQVGDNVYEEITVTGTQLARQRALDSKRDSLRIIDALGVDELGQLPDKNVGESLNRVPGVSMLVEKGEGRFVQIRGIQPSLNNVTLNGVSMGSPEADGGGRATPMDVVSGSLLGAVQVIKTPTPDMDAQGIGGTVNVDVKKPFDREDDFYGYATARYGYEEIRPEESAYGGHDPYALDALVSGKNDAKTMGWLLGASYSSREYIAQGIYQDDWREVSDGVNLPEEVKNNYYVIGRERLNLSAVMEVEPSDTSRYFVRAFYSDWDEFQHRNRYQQSLSEGLVADAPYSGRSAENAVSANIRLETAEKQLLSFAAGGENTFGDWQTDYLVQYNDNELAEPYSSWEFTSAEQFGPNRWDVSADGVVFITPDTGTADRVDPRYQVFDRVQYQERSMQEQAGIGELNLQFNTDEGGFYKTGVKMTQTSRDNDYDRSRYAPGETELTLASEPAFNNGGFVNDVEAGDVPNIWMNVDAMDQFFSDSANGEYFELNDSNTFASNYGSDYEVDESIYAAYGMGMWQWDWFNVIGGVRVEATDIESAGYVMLADGTAERVEDGGDYINWLPSLQTNINLTDSLILRGAITRGLGRPDYDTIAPRSEYEVDAREGFLNIGNPDLEARESWNYDVSLEWYVNDLTLLSAAVFFKDIENELVSRTTEYDGQQDITAALNDLGLAGVIDPTEIDDLTVSTTENGDSSELMGLELTAQTQFAFLPSPFDGLGGSASMSYIDADVEVERNGETVDLPLPGQAESTYNLSLFYQTEKLDLALSYAYNDSFLTDIGGSPEEDIYQGEFGRWDFKASWAMQENLKLFFEAVNLNNEPTTEFQGGFERQNTEYEYVGRTLYVGVSLGF
ncbi:TonB-dependent receptor [Gilvimarinus agarilyticus]|uniref:TonB-dependent receptor n=1 Tax=Gilvimarinus agarilyticus TaxID=679259 RepID=UPI00059F5AF9|nr:TonB-dependent receptor [Gilvimarinus agarilyticus]